MAKETKDVEKNAKPTNKKVENKKIATSNEEETTKKASTKKTQSSAKKSTTTKTKTASTKTTTKKTPATKKSTKSKTTTKSKKSTSKSKSTDKSKKFESEYYDLPYKYNKTVVKVLAQTPTTLFVYWEISEEDIARLKKNYGDNFFEVTKPVLILYNDTLNYFFEIEINDFANSWYIHINDSKCDYHVELGRKPIPQVNNSQLKNDVNSNTPYIPYYVYITSSNNMSAPNDRILFKPEINITFRNVKTGVTRQKDIREFKFISNYGKTTIQELYKHLYPNENFDYKEFLRNPSSGLTSSR